MGNTGFYGHSAARFGTLLATVLGLSCLLSCGGGSSYGTPSAPTPNPGPTPSGNRVTVNIVGSSGSGAFQPNPVHASAGDGLAFHNADVATHHIVLDDGSADLGTLPPGATSAPMRVDGPAKNFHCTLHPSMVGSINGEAPPEPPPCTGYCG